MRWPAPQAVAAGLPSGGKPSGNGGAADQAGPHQPVEPLADRGRRHAQPLGEIADAEPVIHPEQFDNGCIGGTVLGGGGKTRHTPILRAH